MQITSKTPDAQDYERIGDGLSSYTLNKGGPKYEPVSVLFQAVANDRVVGELIATEIWKQLEVGLLIVDGDSRGSGIGKALMARAEEFAAERDCYGVEVSTPKFQGEGFYERLGYKEVFRRPIDSGSLEGRQDKITYYKALKL